MAARKIMILGAIGVGKTSLANRLAFGRFETSYKATIGVDIYTTNAALPGGKAMPLVLWDTDGDFGLSIFRTVYLKGASGALIVADVTRPASLDQIVLPGIRLAMVSGAPRCDIAISWEAGRGGHAVLTTVDQVDRPIDHWVLQQRREQRLLEEKIIAASRELERMNRNLRDFASVAAHDLRAPLRQIVAFTGILRTTLGAQAGPVVSDSLDTIEGCAARLNRMTIGLLDYARLSAESHTFAPVDLGRVVLDATRNLDLDLRAASADLVVGPLPTVNGVPALLTNLFQNLVANSIRYRDPDWPSRIEIRAWPGEPGRITVRDTGIGVPPAFHEAIFETFARVPNGRAPNGVGLGLSICRRIAELPGWRIGVVAEEGPGACFRIDLG